MSRLPSSSGMDPAWESEGFSGPSASRSQVRRPPGPAVGGVHPYFHPYKCTDDPASGGMTPDIVPGQGTSTDVDERAFGIYDLFEGTEQIQQLVISRAISGVHIR